jgi:MFS family permease
MKSESIYKRYLLHSFMQWFGQSLFINFGVLLIYEKTGSLFLTLLFGVVDHGADALMKSLGIGLYSRLLRKIGAAPIMLIGTSIAALSILGLYFFRGDMPYSTIYLFALAAILGMGSAMYWVTSHAIILNSMGQHKSTGQRASLLTTVRQCATIAGAGVTILFQHYANLNSILLVGGVVLLVSTLPLRGVQLKIKDHVRFSHVMKALSWRDIVGNNNSLSVIRVVALPLILFFLFDSVERSVTVTAVSAIGAILFALLSGYFKDKKKIFLNVVAAIASVVVWALYGFAEVPIMFLVLGVADRYLNSIVDVGQMSRLSREVANRHTPLESAAAMEFGRGLSSTITGLALLVIFLLVGDLPQSTLWLGVVLVLPTAIYAIGNLAEHKRRSTR